MFENKQVNKEKKNNKFEIGAIYRCVVDSLGTFTKGQDYIAITENELVDDNGSPVSLLYAAVEYFIKVGEKKNNDKAISFTQSDANVKEHVNHPQHYLQGGIECFDVIDGFYGKQALEDFCLCNSLKYLMRCKLKDNYLDDLKKAKFYIDKIIELHDGKQQATRTV